MYAALGYRFRLAGEGIPRWWGSALADLAVDGPPSAMPFVYGITAKFGDQAQLTGRLGRDQAASVLGQGHEDDLLNVLIDDVRRRAMHERTHIVLHASAVRHGSTTVLMPGNSGAGKTSVAVLLCRRGWGYLGDEMIGLDHEGAPVGCPTPPRLAADIRADLGAGSGGDAAKRFVPLRRVAPRAARPTDARSTHTYVVFLDRAGVRTTLERLSRTRAVAALADAVFAGGDEAEAFGSVAALARRADVYRLSSESVVEAADMVERLVTGAVG
jgi:hypothetical protein